MKTNGAKVHEAPELKEKLPALKNGNFSLVPTNMEEALQYAKLIAESDFAPKDLKGKSGNVLIAVQMGQELGVPPLQAIQNIAVINGRPCVYGDMFIGVVRNFEGCEYVHEDDFETIKKNGRATCRTKRKGDAKEHIGTFSVEDAKTAGLWSKQGPWTQYPFRMLQMRARFVLRDVYGDCLKGLAIREEVEDYPNAIEAETVEAAPGEIAMPQRASEKKPVEAKPAETETVASPVETKPVEAETVAKSEPALPLQGTVRTGVYEVYKATKPRADGKGLSTRWRVQCRNEQNYFTFSESFAKVGQDAKATGSLVEINFTETPYGHDIVRIDMIGDGQDA